MSLVDFSNPLDEDVCHLIDESLYDLLTSLDVHMTLDEKAFEKSEGRKAIVASCFLVGKNPGGSAYYKKSGWMVRTANGSLLSITKKGETLFFRPISVEYMRRLSGIQKKMKKSDGYQTR